MKSGERDGALYPTYKEQQMEAPALWELIKAFWTLYLILLALLAAGLIHVGIEKATAWFNHHRHYKARHRAAALRRAHAGKRASA